MPKKEKKTQNKLPVCFLFLSVFTLDRQATSLVIGSSQNLRLDPRVSSTGEQPCQHINPVRPFQIPNLPRPPEVYKLASISIHTYIRTYIHTHIKHTDNILGIFVSALVRDFGFFVCPRGDVLVGAVSCRDCCRSKRHLLFVIPLFLCFFL